VRRFDDDLGQYETFTQHLTDPRFIWMNYGLDGDDFSWLREEDRDWRYQINMAHHNVRGLDLSGKRVLDTGSGRGGNCDYLSRYHAPAKVVGLDQSESQIAWCQSRFADSGITFIQGDAQDLPFEAGSFEVITNIESACHYPDRKRFYREVHRLLTPGGFFCHSCNYWNPDKTERIIEKIGFTVVATRDITEPVIAALKKNDEHYRQLLFSMAHTDLEKQLAEGLHQAMTHEIPATFNADHRYYSWIFQKS
jgi:O-methyltransferase